MSFQKSFIYNASIGVLVIATVACSTSSQTAVPIKATNKGAPNILLVLADDMGFSDVPGFGASTISMPNLDALAREGVRMTNFHVHPTCSPTRAALLTGSDPHQVGLGSMAEIRTREMANVAGYEGYLNERAYTIAQALKERGYQTFMAGKWHLGMTPISNPVTKGFDKSFALAGGAGSHWDNLGMLQKLAPISLYFENGKRVERPEGFSSDLYTDRILGWLKSRDPERPFFAYLAYQAPHDPLHAPKEYIDKYKGKFDHGYTQEWQVRYERMKQLGIVPNSTMPRSHIPLFEEWEKLTPGQKKHQARLMEIYAAMLDNMDFNIGRVIGYLKSTGQYENTIIMFLSDNGPNGGYMDYYPGNADGDWIKKTFDNRFESLGAKRSFVGLGPGWADASASPFRLFKVFQTEGATLSPLIAKLPGAINQNSIQDSFASVEDIVPTLLEATNNTKAIEKRDARYAPLKGKSMYQVLLGRSETTHPTDYEYGSELFGAMSYRKGDWKIIKMPAPYGNNGWQLYDTRIDRAEVNDLSESYPHVVSELSTKYKRWSEDNGVIAWSPDGMKQIFSYFDWRNGPLDSPTSEHPSTK